MREITFEWPFGGKQVFVVGSFTKWNTFVRMTVSEDDADKFTINVTLPKGHWTFKFFVDHEWRLQDNLPTETDEFGNVNHFVDVDGEDDETLALGANEDDVEKEFGLHVVLCGKSRSHHNLVDLERMELGKKVPRKSIKRPSAGLVSLAAATRLFGETEIGDSEDESAVESHASGIPIEGKLVLVLVGLPARGKTFIGRKLMRYLQWLGHKTSIFNVGNYRRNKLGHDQNHQFFDPSNPEGAISRKLVALEALQDMCGWMNEGGAVAIYDATNTTKDRRAMIKNYCVENVANCQVVYIESVCDDSNTVMANVRETKLSSPDYVGMAAEEAVNDFLKRIAHYEKVYETIDDDEEISYIKLINVGQKMISSSIRGYLSGRLMFFLANLHVTPRPIYLTRHGQSLYNVKELIGGDSALSDKGESYAISLAEFIDDKYPQDGEELQVWTSTLQRTILTARHIKRTPLRWRALDEIDSGICDGMTYEQIAEKMPAEYAARQKDKLHYRYPRGESYMDVIHRLEPLIMELERCRKPVVVVAHQAVLRVLYGYLMDIPPVDCPTLSMPLHTVIQLIPKAYGVGEKRFKLNTPVDATEGAPPANPVV